MMPVVATRTVLVLAVVLTGASALFAALLIFSGGGELNVYLAVMVILLGLAPVIRSLTTGGDYFEIINLFCLIFVLSTGIRGLAIMSTDSRWLSSYDISSGAYDSVMSYVFVYSILALLALYTGYWSGLGTKVATRIPRFVFFPDRRETLVMVSVVAIMIGVMGSYLFLVEIGGSSVMADSSTMIEEGIESGGRLYYSLLLEFAAVGFLFLFIGRVGIRGKATERVLLGVFTLLMLLNFLMLPFKGQIIGVLLYVLIAVNYLRRRVSLKSLLVMAVILILLLSVLDNYRKYGIDSLDQVWSEFAEEFSDPGNISDLTIGRSAGADMFFLALERTPDPNPYLYGDSLAKVFTSFIPRPLYPDKTWSFGMDFSNNYLNAPLLASISPSTIGELYINFHVAGIITGFFVIGVFLRTVYAYCISNSITREGAIIYAIILEKMMMLVDGPVSDFIVFVLIKLFPVAVLGVLAMLLATNSEKRIVKHS